MESPSFKGSPTILRIVSKFGINSICFAGNIDNAEKVSRRSGRVLKKSSKLADFASPDDIETTKLRKIDKAARKQLNMVKITHKNFAKFLIFNLAPFFVDAVQSHQNGIRFGPES